MSKQQQKHHHPLFDNPLHVARIVSFAALKPVNAIRYSLVTTTFDTAVRSYSRHHLWQNKDRWGMWIFDPLEYAATEDEEEPEEEEEDEDNEMQENQRLARRRDQQQAAAAAAAADDGDPSNGGGSGTVSLARASLQHHRTMSSKLMNFCFKVLQRGLIYTVGLLLDAGIDITVIALETAGSQCPDSDVPDTANGEHDTLPLIKYLIEKRGFDPNYRPTPWHSWSCCYGVPILECALGSDRLMDYLLSLPNIDPDVPFRNEDETALSHIISRMEPECDPYHYRRMTPEMQRKIDAARRKDIKKLLEVGADPCHGGEGNPDRSMMSDVMSMAMDFFARDSALEFVLELIADHSKKFLAPENHKAGPRRLVRTAAYIYNTKESEERKQPKKLLMFATSHHRKYDVAAIANELLALPAGDPDFMEPQAHAALKQALHLFERRGTSSSTAAHDQQQVPSHGRPTSSSSASAANRSPTRVLQPATMQLNGSLQHGVAPTTTTTVNRSPTSRSPVSRSPTRGNPTTGAAQQQHPVSPSRAAPHVKASIPGPTRGAAAAASAGLSRGGFGLSITGHAAHLVPHETKRK